MKPIKIVGVVIATALLIAVSSTLVGAYAERTDRERIESLSLSTASSYLDVSAFTASLRPGDLRSAAGCQLLVQKALGWAGTNNLEVRVPMKTESLMAAFVYGPAGNFKLACDGHKFSIARER